MAQRSMQTEIHTPESTCLLLLTILQLLTTCYTHQSILHCTCRENRAPKPLEQHVLHKGTKSKVSVVNIYTCRMNAGTLCCQWLKYVHISILTIRFLTTASPQNKVARTCVDRKDESLVGCE
jgi:hypothetical protein